MLSPMLPYAKWQQKFYQGLLRLPFSVKNCQIIILHYGEKYFFSFLTNVFFIYIKVASCCEESPKKNKKKRSLIGNMVFGGFPKKIRNKTFYFHRNFFFHFILFLLSFGPRVHFRSQTWTFMLNTPKYKFQSKTVKLSYFTLEKSFFFRI
jgi:hypothetical protein